MTLWGLPIWVYLFFIALVVALTWFRIKRGHAHGRLSVTLAVLSNLTIMFGIPAMLNWGISSKKPFLAGFLALFPMIGSSLLDILSERVKTPKDADGKA